MASDPPEHAAERFVCAGAELRDAGPGVRFAVTLGGRGEPAFAIRFQGRVRAYLNRCAHARAQLDWTEGRFFDDEARHLVCSLHGALYAPDTGQCAAGGPCAGGALTPLAIEERDGGVFLIDARNALPAD